MIKLSKKKTEELKVQMTESYAKEKVKIMNFAKRCFDSFQPILTEQYIKNGKTLLRCYCRKCGSEFDGEYRFSSAKTICPNCGNANHTSEFMLPYNRRQLVYFLNQEDGIIQFVTFPAFVSLKKTGDNFEYMKSDFQVTLMKEKLVFGIFQSENGIKLFHQGKTLAKNTSLYKTIIDGFCNFFSNDRKIQKFISDKLKMQNVKNASDLDPYASYSGKNVEIPQYSNIPLLQKVNQIGNTAEGYFYCPNCKEVSFITINAMEGRKCGCPHCGYVPSRYTNAISEETIIFYELMGETILARYFCRNAALNNKKYVVSITESQRIFMDKKGIHLYCFSKESGIWKKERLQTLFAPNLSTIQTKEEIREIWEHSYLKYSGYLEYLEHMEEFSAPHNFGQHSYIHAWYKDPRIELFTKVGLFPLVKNLMQKNDLIPPKKGEHPTIYTALGVSKPVFRIGKEAGFSFVFEFQTLQRLYETDPSIDLELYQTIKRIDPGFINILYISEHHGISVKRQLEYLDSCYMYQCIEKEESLTIWKDYLRMAKDLKYNLKDKSIKYPSSLKKEHDKAIFAYNLIKQEIEKEHFEKQALAAKEKYSYSFGNYQIVVPEEPEDIIAEAESLKHCVKSYITPMAEGHTCVVFIRKKEDPEKSFYTMEICNEAIKQVRGYCNEGANDNVKVFVEKFAKAKHLHVHYR